MFMRCTMGSMFWALHNELRLTNIDEAQSRILKTGFIGSFYFIFLISFTIYNSHPLLH